MKSTFTTTKVEGLQALRAFACFLVLFQHTTFYTCFAKNNNIMHLMPINIGQIGVGIFFVLSGYVMGGCLNQGKSFLWNRAVRIYPPFWLALALTGLMSWCMSKAWHFDLCNVFLLPRTIKTVMNTYYVIPAWTLMFEMAFYVVVYLMILTRLTRAQIATICCGWLTLIWVFETYHTLLKIDPVPDWLLPGWWILLSPRSVFFAFGLLLSIANPDFLKRTSTLHLSLGALILCWLGHSITFKVSSPAYLIQALSYCLILIIFARSEFPRWLVRIGDFSYGAYLMHMAPMALAADLLAPHAASIKFPVLWLIVMMVGGSSSLAFGWLEYTMYTKFFKRGFPEGLRKHLKGHNLLWSRFFKPALKHDNTPV